MMETSTREILVALGVGFVLTVLVLAFAYEAPADPQKQAAALINAFANDALVLQAHPATLTPGRKEDPSAGSEITQGDRKEAARLVEALCRADLDALQSFADRYEGRDSAAQRVSYVACMSLHLAGSKFRILVDGDYVFVQAAEPLEGHAFVTLVAGKPPYCQCWRPIEGGGFTSVTCDIPPQLALNGIANSLTRSFKR